MFSAPSTHVFPSPITKFNYAIALCYYHSSQLALMGCVTAFPIFYVSRVQYGRKHKLLKQMSAPVCLGCFSDIGAQCCGGSLLYGGALLIQSHWDQRPFKCLEECILNNNFVPRSKLI